jgi:hypothetical protein
MTETYKVLGQAAPSLDTLTDLYTVPAGKSAVVGAVTVAHIGVADDPTATYRVSVAVNGEGDAAKQIVLNDLQLALNVAETHKLGLTLGAGDVVRVRARDAQCAFNLFGAEIA